MIDLKAIRARLSGITGWKPTQCEIQKNGNGEGYVPEGACLGGTVIQLGDQYENYLKDWTFLAHAPSDIRALLKRVRELEADVKFYKRAWDAGNPKVEVNGTEDPPLDNRPLETRRLDRVQRQTYTRAAAEDEM